MRAYIKRAIDQSPLLTEILHRDHAAELGNSRPSRPFFFLKPPSSILPPHDETPTTERPLLQIPNGVVAHHEVELALVMSKLLVHKPNLSMEEALSSIEGSQYTSHSDRLPLG